MSEVREVAEMIAARLGRAYVVEPHTTQYRFRISHGDAVDFATVELESRICDLPEAERRAVLSMEIDGLAPEVVAHFSDRPHVYSVGAVREGQSMGRLET